MRIKLVEISESDFKEINLPILFEDKSSDRVFGVLSDGKIEYKVGWQSTSIKPEIEVINEKFCSIGVDLIFVIFDFYDGGILLKLNLDYFFYCTKTYNGFLFVITELEVIKIEIANFSVSATFDLPDYVESINLNEMVLVIKCISDEVVEIKL